MKTAYESPMRRARRREAVAARATALMAFPVTLVGCGYSGGEALFMSGLFPRPTLKAEFRLTEQPVAILVDDFQEQSQWPETTIILAEEITEELKRTHAAPRIVPAADVQRIRQAHSDFDDRSTREIGEWLEAHQVIAVELRSFLATPDPTQASAAARMSVAVKVINVLEKERPSHVRLWPRSPDGKLLDVELSAAEVSRAKGRVALLRALAKPLAVKIVQCFRDRKAEDFEKP